MDSRVRAVNVLTDPLSKSAGWPSARTGWYATGVLALAYFVSVLDRAVMSLLVEPIKASLALSDTQISLLVGFAFALFYALAGIPLAYIADRANRKALIAISVTIWSVITACCGLATGFWSLFLMRVGVGIGEAGLNPAAMSMLSDHFPPNRRHFPLTTFMVGGALGAGLALATGAVLLQVGETLTIGLPFVGMLEPWQWVFVLVALPGVPVALLVSTLQEPARRGVISSAEIGDRADADMIYLRRHWRCLAALVAGSSLLLIVYMAQLVWGPTLLVRVHGLDLKTAGVLFGIPCFIAGLAGNFAGAALARWITRRGRDDGAVQAIMLIAALALVPMTVGPLLGSPTTVMWALTPAIGLMIGTSAVSLVGLQLVFPNRLRARTVAIYNLFANLLGFGLGPTLVGVLTDYVYRDERLVHYSVATVTLVCIPLAILALSWGRRYFRIAAAEARSWSNEPASA